MASLPLSRNPNETIIRKYNYTFRTGIRNKYVNGTLVQSIDPWRQLRTAHSEELALRRSIPDYHRRKNSGELLPFQPYLNISRDVEIYGPETLLFGPNPSANTEFEVKWKSGAPSPICYLQCGSAIHGPDPQNAVNSLVKELGIDPMVYVQGVAAKLYSRGWDGLTFLAELHKVVRMFRTVLPKLITTVKRMLKDPEWAYVKYLKTNAFNDWLEARYGWRILMYDILDIQRAINDIDEDQRVRNKDRVGESFTHITSETFVNTGQHRLTCEVVREYNLSVRGSCIADFTPARVSLNPGVTLWELIPFSFVIDWVVGVGRALEAMSFLTLADKYTASYGFYCDGLYTATQDVTFLESWVGGHSNFDECAVIDRWTLKKRRPCLVSKLPSLDLKLNAFKVMDLVALLLQVLRR